MSGLNDLMLALFPDNAELAALTKAAVAPMPDCVPLSLSLDGLLKHSAHHHHTAAEHEAEADEKRRQEIAEAKEERVVPRDPLQMTPEELNQASRLIATCQLKGQSRRRAARPARSSRAHPSTHFLFFSAFCCAVRASRLSVPDRSLDAAPRVGLFQRVDRLLGRDHHGRRLPHLLLAHAAAIQLCAASRRARWLGV